MKHTLKVTVALVFFFFMAQFVGLLVINHYIDHKKTAETKTVAYKPLPYNFERPEVKNKSASFIYITLAILIGTILVLLLIKFNKPFIWRFWFFATVWITLAIAFSAFINNALAGILALIISILKLYKPNVIIQNLSEIFIYGGLAAIFVPMINLFAAFMLLIVISVYDFVAVFKTRHMIKLAKFQSKSKIFAGLLIPYARENQRFSGHKQNRDFAVQKIQRIFSHQKSKGFFSERGKISVKAIHAPESEIKQESKRHKHSMAVLGGGDIGFTLIFAGAVMQELMLNETVLTGFLKTLIIPIFVSFALLVLLLKGQQNKFYPAMPVLSLGCFIGYFVVWLI